MEHYGCREVTPLLYLVNEEIVLLLGVMEAGC